MLRGPWHFTEVHGQIIVAWIENGTVLQRDLKQQMMSKLDVIVVFAIMQDRLGVDKLCYGMALWLRSKCAVILCTYFWLQRRLILFSQKPIGVNLDCSDCSAKQLVKDTLCWNVVGTLPVYSHMKNTYSLYSVRIFEVVHVVGSSIAICGKAGKWRILCQWDMKERVGKWYCRVPSKSPLHWNRQF